MLNIVVVVPGPSPAVAPPRPAAAPCPGAVLPPLDELCH